MLKKLVVFELLDSEGGLIGSEEKAFPRCYYSREATIPANERLIGFKVTTCEDYGVMGIAPVTAENI